jgi:hypothetical protein
MNTSVVKSPKSLRWRRYSPLVAAFLACCVCLVAVWFFFNEEAEPETKRGPAVEFPALNCRFSVPGDPWHKSDRRILTALQAQLVLERPRPRTWLALIAQDYGKRTLSDAELRDEALRRLGGYFNGDNLEWEERPDVQLAGLPAHCFAFQGEVDNTALRGECSMLFADGRAYWLVLWFPGTRLAGSAREYADLRSRLTFLDQAEPDRAAPALKRLLQLPGTTATLLVNDPDWQEWKPATDYDLQAILALVMREQRRSSKEKGPPPAVVASAVFLTLLPGEENADKASRRALDSLEKQQKTLYPDTKIERLAGDALDAARGGSLKLIPVKARNGENRVRYVLLGLLPGKSRVLLAQCECAWAERSRWEPQMKNLLFGLKTGDTKRDDKTDQVPGGVPGD